MYHKQDRSWYTSHMAKMPLQPAVEALGATLGADDPTAGEDEVYGPQVPGACNAKITRADEKRRCKNAAGAGTIHLGYGTCKWHFGSTAIQIRNASRQQYAADYAGRMRFGEAIDIDPLTGILTEINRTAGFVAFLQERIGETNDGTGDPELVQQTESGPIVAPLVALWRSERGHFVQACRIAGALGVAQAQIDLMQVMGDHLADLVESVVRDLGHDPHDPEVEAVVIKRMALIGPAGAVASRVADPTLTVDEPDPEQR